MLRERYPDKVSVLRFDDYHLENEEDVPILEGFRNWDHPDCIEFEKLVKDLRDLKNGNPITVRTWGSRENPGYRITKQRIEIAIQPKKIILVEGYLVLWHPEVRSILDIKIYLKAPDDIRLKRRNKLKGKGYEGYNEKVLIPMHNKYLKPTEKYADYVFDTAEMNKQGLLSQIEKMLSL